MNFRLAFFFFISISFHVFIIFILSFQIKEYILPNDFISSVNLEFSNYQRFDRPKNLKNYKNSTLNSGSILESSSKKLETRSKESLETNKYVSSWQRKIETIGNLNFPNFINSFKAPKLTLSVTIGKSGNLLDYALLKTSGNHDLDKAAIEIIEMAFPFKEFPVEMSSYSEITIIRDWKFGNQERKK